ncbi:DUF1349 domain-containing protein [Paludibaculum fermentans]|uniref:DUF1349 domain-containing protein n=1 Tax=Paludibaculum fermentans TaxID=1473598 RepID=UPI003EB696F9
MILPNEPILLPALPGALHSTVPDIWRVDEDVLHGQAQPGTDLFLDPIGDARKLDAAMLLFQPDAEFALSACVEVDFQSTFDAGVLVLYQDESNWAKLCFEFSPQGRPMVVTVVTRGVSDDCNSVTIEGNRVFLRAASIGRGFGFHYATSAHGPWHLARAFGLEPLPVKAGFLVQSPMGQGCQVRFSAISYTSSGLKDLRNGE